MFFRKTFDCVCVNDLYITIRNEKVKVATSGEYFAGYYVLNHGIPCFKVGCGEFGVILYDDSFNYYFRIVGEQTW